MSLRVIESSSFQPEPARVRPYTLSRSTTGFGSIDGGGSNVLPGAGEGDVTAVVATRPRPVPLAVVADAVSCRSDWRTCRLDRHRYCSAAGFGPCSTIGGVTR